MHAAVVVVHVLISLFLIGLILVQHGKGADAGAAFGSGASATVFGARGSASFLSKTTAVLALCFFSTSFWLNHLSASTVEKSSLIQNAADTGSTDVVETTIEPIEDDEPAGAEDTDLPDVPGTEGDDDRPAIGPDPKPEDMSEGAKDADEPPTDKGISKAREDAPVAPPDDKKTAPPDPEPAQPTATPAPEKPSEPSGPDAPRPSVNAPVKGEVKPAPEPGAAPLESSEKPADKAAKQAAAEKVPAEKKPAEKSR
ncbi:MAG: preprotein translocase subunit SecG [Chromatiales bacterium]